MDSSKVYCFVITIYGSADNFDLFSRESGWNFSFPLNLFYEPIKTSEPFRYLKLRMWFHVTLDKFFFSFSSDGKGCVQNPASASADEIKPR